jgi:hypothetical protein
LQRGLDRAFNHSMSCVVHRSRWTAHQDNIQHMGRGNSDPFGDLLEGILGGGQRAPQRQPQGSGNGLDDFFGAEGRGQSNESIDDILAQIQGGRQPSPARPSQQSPRQEHGGGGLEDILGGGAAGRQPQMPQGGSILDVIGAILGGGGGMPVPQQPRQQPMPQSGGGLEDILGGILGGGQSMPQQRPQQMPQGGGGLEDILGGILGGGQSMPQQRPQQIPQGGGLEDILGGILGGGQQPQQQPQMPGMGGGIMDIIGAVLGGGGGAMMGANPILAPIVNAISRKLGLPPFVVSIGLSLLLGKLINGAAKRAQQPRQSPKSAPSGAGGGLDLDDILKQIKGGSVNRKQLENSGVIDEIAKETGLGAQDAGSLAEEILRELGSNGSAQPGPRQSGPKSHGKLKDLLNTW